MLDRDFDTATIDLSDLCVHNGIEHDASLTRAPSSPLLSFRTDIDDVG